MAKALSIKRELYRDGRRWVYRASLPGFDRGGDAPTKDEAQKRLIVACRLVGADRARYVRTRRSARVARQERIGAS